MDASVIERMLTEMSAGRPRPAVDVVGSGGLPSVFPVTELAAASIAAAGAAVSESLASDGGRLRPVIVDRRLASMWFAGSLRPDGWQPPPPWDAVAGDYRTSDGWIRLHTNAEAHRRAALEVLGVPADRDQVAAAVVSWSADDLESAVVGAGGCAAAMRSTGEWEASEPGRSVATEPLVAWSPSGTTNRPLVSPRDEAPLAGVRVLDLTRVLAGPVATRFLSQLGADVLRIDPPWWDEPGVVPEVTLGKRCARLDLREARGRKRILELLGDADVLIHGYRPGALASLGLDEDVRREVAPGLVEVSLDAYGFTGPWAGRRGFDSLVQMSTGIADAGMRVLGRDVPTPLPVQALDHATGYLMASAAIRGLTERLRTRRGVAARLSLARTARLLTEHTPTDDRAALDGPLRSEDFRDQADEIELTSWGPARRLRMPVEIPGVPFQAGLPASDLGTSQPVWAR